MTTRKLADLVIHHDPRYYCGPGPAAVAFPDGEVAVFFRRHRSWTPTPMQVHVHPSTEMCFVRSTDGCETWGPPRVFIGGGQCAGATRLRDGTVIFTTHRMEVVPEEMREGPPEQSSLGLHERLRDRRGLGVIAAGTEFWRSEDRCETWEGPFWIDDVPGLPPTAQGLHAPVQHRAFPVELRDGSVAMTVQGRGVGSIFVVSEDGGRTWQFRSVAARNPEGGPEQAFNEWTVRETPKGDLVGFHRSALPREQGGRLLWTTRSSDGGYTWAAPESQDVWGHPYFPLPLPDGRALLVYGHRRDPFGIRCRVLDPECERTGEAEECVLRDDGLAGDLGYPHATLLPDGRALVVYYFHTEGMPQRHVAGSVLEIG